VISKNWGENTDSAPRKTRQENASFPTLLIGVFTNGKSILNNELSEKCTSKKTRNGNNSKSSKLRP
jgi:hypothetical protein